MEMFGYVVENYDLCSTKSKQGRVGRLEGYKQMFEEVVEEDGGDAYSSNHYFMKINNS